MTKSLATVLAQALTADDTETLDWVLTNRDDSTVTNTLLSLKEHKLISSLFKQIVIRFQTSQQEAAKQTSILLWLRTLISVHWLTIIKKADKEDLLSLGQIQSSIQKKTKTLDRVLLLKGKLDMLQKTFELTKSVSGTKQSKAQKEKGSMLVYQDAEDEDEQMLSEHSGESDDDGDYSEDEEIKETDIRQAKSSKRQKKDV